MNDKILEELKNNIGSGININFKSGRLILGESVKGIITRTIGTTFVECDFCSQGNKIQRIDIGKIADYAILSDGEREILKNDHGFYKHYFIMVQNNKI